MATRKNATSETTTADESLNLDAGVTSDQFLASLNAMHAYGQELARAHSWCSGWYSYLQGISTHFPADRYGAVTDVTVDTPLPREWFTDAGYNSYVSGNTERAVELRRIRGRILYWVNRSKLRLREANDLLIAGGLTPHDNSNEQDIYTVYFPAVFVAVPESETEGYAETLMDRFREFLAANVNEPTGDSNPGQHSSTMTVDVARHSRHVNIPADQIVEPIDQSRL